MPLTGGWASRARVRPLPSTAVRTADPEHAATVDLDDAQDWTAPPMPDYGVVGDDPWTSTYYVPTVGAWGDQLPANEPGPAHGFDPGHDYDPGTLATVDAGTKGSIQGRERYVDDNHESDLTPGPPAIFRGINGRPENNPTEPPRQGQRVGRTWIDRQFLAGKRVTDARVTYVNTADTGGGTPELDTVPDAPGRYSQPFSAWARPVNGPPRLPTLRRTPPPISDSVVDDGTDDAQAVDAQADTTWIFG